nr:dynein assembly factor 3, axonemal isoform X2 [Geotrypetes seraphini]XP_033815744.1 dynein assembly factor 3, axonemal isoform X2 [Geotrypetes seraphini]XP_033815745.1 dynein assembly factor 3, axonemal isoform X2 [Geotrypetes seraphini]XP_033815746.1 dynein assembly factor 3, axonemal isoform X2 [Geotrypetes seraphini]XP_033815747.1 dynein assembly factor 3, axonemal isoform X2 [Geotrypetes seraphini]XP_033815748.1 dynein assembly factor 3, axonemal isoform X2 [Geotrypetes seraphini]
MESGHCERWWGFSPALDLQMKCLSSSMENLSVSKEHAIPELNLLLVGCGDGRHLLKTICQAHRWPQRRLNFYVVEDSLALLGRQMLFLALALERPEQMGLQEKSELFLELFGNSLVRSQTAAYLQEKADLFIRYVTDLEFQQRSLPMLDLSALKFKERDLLEVIFKFWRNPDPYIFPMERLWDSRSRQYLGSRYDFRRGAFDWDLCMKIHERGASTIGHQQYYRWRESGVAFEIREGIYDVPNKSLAIEWHLKSRRGIPLHEYRGDIITGPYIAFGIETEETSLLKTFNGQRSKTAQDISHYNVTALFHELVAQKLYTPRGLTEAEEKGEDRATLQEAEPRHPGRASQKEGEHRGSATGEEEPDFLCPKYVKIHFLSLGSMTELHHKAEYQNLFNLVYFSSSMMYDFKPELKLLSAPRATLIVEGVKFLVDYNKDEIKNFADRVTKEAKDASFLPFRPPSDTKKNLFMVFELEDKQ